jgi:hypothetical protein
MGKNSSFQAGIGDKSISAELDQPLLLERIVGQEVEQGAVILFLGSIRKPLSLAEPGPGSRDRPETLRGGPWSWCFEILCFSRGQPKT